MNINMTLYATGATILNNILRITYAEEQTPEAIEYNIEYPPIHVFPKNITQFVDNDVAYRVRIYTTPDSGTLGTLLAEFVYDPSYTRVVVRARLQFVAGGSGPYDPIEGTKTLQGNIDGSNPDPMYADISTFDWTISVRALGGDLLEPDSNQSGEYIKTNGDTNFEITIEDFAFTEGDIIFMYFAPQISTATPNIIIRDEYRDRIVITAPPASALDADYYDKYIDIAYTSATGGAIPLPPLSTVPNNRMLKFRTMFGGTQKQVAIVADGDDPIYWNLTAMEAVFMGRADAIDLYKRPDGWFVANEAPGMRECGRWVPTDTGAREAPLLPNFYVFDGAGYPVSDYPRILWYAQRLPAAQFITRADRDADPKKAGLWAYDVDGGGLVSVVYLPNHLGMHYRNIPNTRVGVDSGRTAASTAGSEDGSFPIEHRHHTVVAQNWTSSSFPSIVDFVKRMMQRWDKPGSGKESYFLAGSDAEPTASPTSKPINQGTYALESRPENTVKTIGAVAGILL